MASPLKPWERGSDNVNEISGESNSRAATISSSASEPNFGSALQVDGKPPIPPRPRSQNISSMASGYGYGNSMYNSYRSGIGGFGYGSYGGYGGYGGGYGSYGLSGPYSSFGYGGYGMQDRQGLEGDGNDFLNRAEENSRAAFQAIESIVQAFGSVTMMLESTFHAVHSSFRAVLGVAENFSRLRGHFSAILSTFSLIRALRYIYNKLLTLLRIRRQNVDEQAWNQAENLADSIPKPPSPNHNDGLISWPLGLFAVVAIGGPWLIWKIIKGVETNSTNSRKSWATGQTDHLVARAEYDFKGESRKEISFRRGDVLRIAPKDHQPRVKGWLLASLDGENIGIVPYNYVKILGRRKGSDSNNIEARNKPDQISNPNAKQLTNSIPSITLDGEVNGTSDPWSEDFI